MTILLKIVQESLTDSLSGPVTVGGHPGGERVGGRRVHKARVECSGVAKDMSQAPGSHRNPHREPKEPPQVCPWPPPSGSGESWSSFLFLWMARDEGIQYGKKRPAPDPDAQPLAKRFGRLRIGIAPRLDRNVTAPRFANPSFSCRQQRANLRSDQPQGVRVSLSTRYNALG